jgi:hypothetical protein
MFPDGSFQGLDQLKQQGFYSQPKQDEFVVPSRAVERNVAEAIHDLAWRASSTLDFLLKQGNLRRYIEAARVLRAKLTEADHQRVEQMGEVLFDALFPEPTKPDG